MTQSASLSAWEKTYSDELDQHLDELLARREFLGNMIKSAAALPLAGYGLISGCHNPEKSDTDTNTELQQEPWLTLAMVQQILFPDDGDGPSARDINADGYLYFALHSKDADAEERKFILKGVTWLDGIASETRQKPFKQLNAQQQNAILQQINRSRAGERWLSLLLTYIMEALLSDPVYGGNPAGIGWRWLEHQAGFPLPPPNKRYVDLL